MQDASPVTTAVSFATPYTLCITLPYSSVRVQWVRHQPR